MFRNLAAGQAAGLTILPLYFAVIVLIGWLARSGSRSSRSFLNASHSLPLPIVVAAYLAANCGALEMVGLSAMAAQYGVQAFHFYWIGAIPAMIFLALWMMPVYRRSHIATVPEYLEKRFGLGVRLLNACIVAVILLLLAGISLYAMGEVLEVAIGLSFGLSILFSAGVVLAYILLGGLKATIYNEVFQLFVMVAGLAPLAYRACMLLRTGALTVPERSAHLWRTLPLASTHSPMDQTGIILGLGFVLSFGYWCTDFVQMQRAFTARTEQEARQVPLWAGLGKLCFSLMVVLPGLAAGRLFPVLQQSQHFDQALPKAMVELYGPAMFGLGMTAIVASLTSGLAANVCAFASVTTNDIYRSYIRQSEDDRHYLRFGRLATVLAILISLCASYINFFFHNLMEHVQLIFSVFGAPFWAIFLLGMSTRRTDARGAICGFLSGTAVAVLHLIATTCGWIHYGSNMNANFHVAIYAFVVAVTVGWFTSDRRMTDHKRHLVFHWRTGVTGPGRAALFALSAVLAAACLALNIYWR